MEKRFNDFYEAFNFLREHEMCKCKPYLNGEEFKYKVNYFESCLAIDVVKVNSANLTIEENESLNTKTQVWLEFGKAFIDEENNKRVAFTHDFNLDCEADTFEESIIQLANLVDKYYNDDGSLKEE